MLRNDPTLGMIVPVTITGGDSVTEAPDGPKITAVGRNPPKTLGLSDLSLRTG